MARVFFFGSFQVAFKPGRVGYIATPEGWVRRFESDSREGFYAPADTSVEKACEILGTSLAACDAARAAGEAYIKARRDAHASARASARAAEITARAAMPPHAEDYFDASQRGRMALWYAEDKALKEAGLRAYAKAYAKAMRENGGLKVLKAAAVKAANAAGNPTTYRWSPVNEEQAMARALNQGLISAGEYEDFASA